MKPISLAIRCAAASAALGACTSLPVTTDTNPNVSAASCHTYVFALEHYAAPASPAAPMAIR